MADIITISVSMPAEMQRLIMEQIKARFFGNISEYFRHLVREDLDTQRDLGKQAASVEETEGKTRELGFRETLRSQGVTLRGTPSSKGIANAISDAEVERLRRRYPIQAVEKLHAESSPGSPERKRLARILKVLRGEGTPEERFVWWDYMDLEFFNMLRHRFNLGDDPDELGGSTVKSPKSPKPRSGSARAKPPRDEG